MTFAFGVFFVTFVRAVIVDGSPLASVSDFRIWDIEAKVFTREFVGLPATFLVVVLNDEPETVREVEFDREIRAFVVHVVSCFVSDYFKRCGFDEVLGNVTSSPLVKG